MTFRRFPIYLLMDMKPAAPSSFSRQPRSAVLMAWQWIFNLATLAVVWFLATNWPALSIHVRLAPAQSLFRSPWLLLLAAILVLLLTAFLHELGHVLGGRLAGLRFQLLGIGPLRLSRLSESAPLRLGWEWTRGFSFFDGVASSLPHDEHLLPRRMLLFALGGPLASLLQALLGMLLFFWANGSLDRALQWAWLWEAGLLNMVVPFFFFLTTMRPAPYPSGLPADGQRIWMLLAQPAGADRWCALLAINALDSQGKRPREWPDELLARALAFPDQSVDSLHALLLAAKLHMDRQEWAAARGYLAHALDQSIIWSGGLAFRFAMEKAFLAAWQEQDVAEGQRLLAQLRRGPREPLALRLATAVHLAQGDLPAARDTAIQAQEMLALQPWTGSIQAEIDLLHKMVSLQE